MLVRSLLNLIIMMFLQAGDVALPPWATGSPREFISKQHWEALEPGFLRKFASLDRPYFWI